MKVFGIGLSKTGTKSLTVALRLLGYKAVHYPPLNKIHELLVENDAVTDITVTERFVELDAIYPESKFILTVRDYDEWIISIHRHFSKWPFSDQDADYIHHRIYGTTRWDYDKFTSAYASHMTSITSYFKKRNQDLLVINICAGDGWSKLCSFLNRPIPVDVFPHIKQRRQMRTL